MSRSVVTWAGALVTVTGLTLTAGCSGSDGLDSSRSASTSSATSASPSPSATVSSPAASASASTDPEVEAVTADFQHYNSGYEKAVRARNDRVPELIRYSTARLHAQDRAFVAQLKQRGLIFKGQSQVYVKKVTIVANRAQLRVCHHDSAGYYVYANTGKSPVTVKDRWISYEVRAVQRDGRWQLNQYDKRKFSCEGAH